MTCDNCHQRPAKYHVTRIINGQRSEEDLCEECALQRGELPVHLQPASAIHELLAGLLEGAVPPLIRPQEQRCPSCGLTQSEFARTGMLGCEGCYAAFVDTLRPLVRRVQGSGRHLGKRPGAKRAAPRPAEQPAGRTPPDPALQISSLREQLQAAVQAEDFERAATLRDRIRELEGSGRHGHA
jgi:protein arginine kinase activator